jgi:hypothetical protein
MARSNETAQNARTRRLLLAALVLVVIAAVRVFLLGDGDGRRGSGGGERGLEAPATATGGAPPAAARASREEGAGEALPEVFVASEEGTLTIPVVALEEGRPIEVELRLAPDEISDQPMTASIRSGGETYELGAAKLDPATGRARLSIDPNRLAPGQHLLAIRVADDSWNPHRRIAITVTED